MVTGTLFVKLPKKIVFEETDNPDQPIRRLSHFSKIMRRYSKNSKTHCQKGLFLLNLDKSSSWGAAKFENILNDTYDKTKITKHGLPLLHVN